MRTLTLKRLSILGLSYAWLIACGSDKPSSNRDGDPSTETGNADAGRINLDAARPDAAPARTDSSTRRDAALPEVPSDSTVCGLGLSFKPEGCSCTPGDRAACWTGPAAQRNVRDCHDGEQTCELYGEFGKWGPCEGQQTECGEPPAEPPADCGCVPGAIVGCDEDCEAFVICAPFSTKVCQPDGTFGPCREARVPTADTNLLGCINVFHGCYPENPEGTFTGDCSKAFTCGAPPGGLLGP